MHQQHIRSSNVPSRAGRWLLPMAGLLLLAANGCSHAATETRTAAGAAPTIDASPHDVQPGDWIVVRQGKTAQRDVISRDEYVALRRQGAHVHVPNSLERKPPNLLDAQGPLRVKVGQVETFTLEDAPVKRMTLSGGTVEAYWTRPYTIHRREADGSISVHQGSDIYFRGFAPGRSHLEIEFTNGAAPKQVEIEGAPSRAHVG